MDFPKLLATNKNGHQLWVLEEAGENKSGLGPLVNVKFPDGLWRLEQPIPLLQYLKMDADWMPVEH
jgi:hypothetical protein